MKSAPSVAIPTYFSPGLALAFRDVPYQPILGVLAFASQVGLQLEDGPSEQGIDPATHFGCLLLEVDILTVGSKVIDKEAMKQHPDLFVAGTGRQFRDQFVSFFVRQHAKLPATGLRGSIFPFIALRYR